MKIGPKIKQLSFTVLELMVVVAIIAVLAALIIPTVGSAKEKAFQVKCANNLRQIGMGIEYYKEDHDSCYPFPSPTAYSYWDKWALMNELGSNYIKNSWGVFSCPASRNRKDLNLRVNGIAGARMDYEINSGVFGMKVNGTNSFWHGPPDNRNESINIPTIAVVIYDWPGPNYYGILGGPLDPNIDPMPHPSGGINAYFADGHVSWITYEDSATWKQGQSPFYKWGRDP